ncbi:phage tail protein [Histophilus somni]|uniref:phage tail protein n=1 Tax=Histophilus somni TaxID=731 RepID=UPI00201E7E88|nr:phage tail protein [Histophilus somni]
MNHLLPPNSTPLEQRLSQANALAFNLGEQQLRGLKITNPPQQWHKVLVWEYGLNELTAYLPNERLLKEGLDFLRIKGTALAVKTALSWVNIQANIQESPPSSESNAILSKIDYQPYKHFAEYELLLHQIPTYRQINQILALTELAQPVRARLWRLIYNYDRSILHLDEGNLDHHYLTDDSGWLAQHTSRPIKLSLEQKCGRHIRNNAPQISTAIEIQYKNHTTSWEVNTLYLDDQPEIKEVYSTNVKSGSEQVSPVYYTEQVWTAATWTDASRWTDTKTLITVKATIKERK